MDSLCVNSKIVTGSWNAERFKTSQTERQIFPFLSTCHQILPLLTDTLAENDACVTDCRLCVEIFFTFFMNIITGAENI